MIPGVNPKQMEKMMKQMGMKQEALSAVRVEIFMEDGKKLIFDEPDVQRVKMMGQETYQLSGTPHEESVDSTPEISAEDVQTVIDQTGTSEESARAAIEDAGGDLAEAIMNLKD